jgi:hypothetical protein
MHPIIRWKNLLTVHPFERAHHTVNHTPFHPIRLSAKQSADRQSASTRRRAAAPTPATSPSLIRFRFAADPHPALQLHSMAEPGAEKNTLFVKTIPRPIHQASGSERQGNPVEKNTPFFQNEFNPASL